MVKPFRSVSLVPFRDNYTGLRRERSALSDAADAKRHQSIVCRAFGEKHAPLDDEIEQLTAFIRDQLGNARYYSLDNDAQRHRRLDALEAMV